jgi:hypothetical protein
MLGKKDIYRLVRALIAACLALVLSSASLVQLSARSFSAPASCGRSQAKCCCRKNATAPYGLAFSSKSCESDCCHLTLGGIAASGFVQPSCRVVAPQAGILTPVCDRETAAAIHLSDSLRQRPPPAHPLA